MSRRRGGNNDVRGPTSALTSFLKEQGIDTRSLSTWRRRDEEEEEDQNAVAGPSNAGAAPPSSNVEAGPSTPNRSRQVDSGYNSDDLDGEQEEQAKKSKKKPTKAQLEKEKAKAKVAASKKRKRGDDDDDDFEDDEYTAPSKGVNLKAPPIGSFENCAKCEKRFTVTKYTIPCIPPPGFLCHDCAKSSGNDPFKKPAAKKRKAPVDKRKITNFEEKEAVKNLSTMCIEIIGKHLDDIDVLGDIGAVNLQAISGIIAKQRKLTPENVQLFYDVRNTYLIIHDATNLLPPALHTLASLNPNLQRLRLDFCGRMDSAVLKHFSTHLTKLTRVEFHGPFLVRVDGWLSFIQKLGLQLEGFLIFQSPRFDTDCMVSLAQHAASSLTELRLAEIGKMADDWLPHIAEFKHLTYLDLSYPAHSLNDEPVIKLLSAVGPQLSHLDLSGNILLSDDVLDQGVACHATSLRSLIMASLDLLTDKGIASFFTLYESRLPLLKIDFSRNADVGSKALHALLAHSGSTLQELSINSWKTTSSEALMEIASSASKLEILDFGWCREVDDFVVKAILDGCPKLTKIKCYGCNRVTENCPKKRGVGIFGVEAHVAT